MNGRRWGLIAPLMLLACGPGDVEETSETRVAELRPTDPTHPRGYAEDVEVRSHPSPEGYARVWWASSGVDRPPMADGNESGVPDFVELVADVADEVNRFLEVEAWRLPIEDSTLLSAPADYGGDGRFDIYLKDFGGAGDGHFSVDACVQVVNVGQCTGHMVLENDFTPLYYPSREYAVRVVVPHEYFHAVQTAYAANMPIWWSEGSATWFQEHFYPEQNDFEHLTRYYFASPERSLDDRSRGPSDGFAYGAAIFVYFLEQIVGVDAVVEMMERMALGRGALDAVIEVVEERAGAFSEVFSLFGVYNLFTGSRAIAGQGYPEAERFAEVPVTVIDGSRGLNWDVQVASMGARFGRVDFTEPIALSTRSIEGFEEARVVAVSARRFAETGHFDVLGAELPLIFEREDGPIYLVATRVKARDDGAVRIALRMAHVDDGEDESEVTEEALEEAQAQGTGGCAVAGRVGSGGNLAVFFAMAVIWFRQRKRRHG